MENKSQLKQARVSWDEAKQMMQDASLLVVMALPAGNLCDVTYWSNEDGDPPSWVKNACSPPPWARPVYH